MNWIKIEDGKPEAEQPVLISVQAYREKKIVLRAIWCPKFSVEGWTEDEDSEYDEDSDCYYLPEGWYEWNQYDEMHWKVTEAATHWMPLPDPPQEANDGD